MIHEWFQFVNKEKGARLETDKAVAALLQEAANLKADLFAQMEQLRTDGKDQIQGFASEVQEKDKILEDRERRLSAQMIWGVEMLHSKNAAVIQRQALSWWRGVAQRERLCNRIICKCLLRSRDIYRNSAWNKWLEHIEMSRDLNCRVARVLARIRGIRTWAALNCWRQYVENRKVWNQGEDLLSTYLAVCISCIPPS
jgi:hypothetical protein